MRKYERNNFEEEEVFNEEYERGYRAGRRQALREMKSSDKCLTDEDIKKLIKEHELRIIDESKNGQGTKFYSLADSGRNIGTGFCLNTDGKVARLWIKINEEDITLKDIEYFGEIYDNIRSFYKEIGKKCK